MQLGSRQKNTPSRLPSSAKVFVVCGLWLVVLGSYFLFLRLALLPEDKTR